MKFVVSVWCSPKRKEIYHRDIIALDTSIDGVMSCVETLMDYVRDGFTPFFHDLFGDDCDSVGGLWKVVFIIDVGFHVTTSDWGDAPDTDVEFCINNVLFIGKCASFTDLRDMVRGLGIS